VANLSAESMILLTYDNALLVYSECSFGNTKREYLTFRHPLVRTQKNIWIVTGFTPYPPLVLSYTALAAQGGVVYTPRFTPERVSVNIRVHRPGKSVDNYMIIG
jgi:hypothetical protein